MVDIEHQEVRAETLVVFSRVSDLITQLYSAVTGEVSIIRDSGLPSEEEIKLAWAVGTGTTATRQHNLAPSPTDVEPHTLPAVELSLLVTELQDLLQKELDGADETLSEAQQSLVRLKTVEEILLELSP